MKHDQILENLLAEAERDQNHLAVMLFGSVAAGTQRADSDLDVITILRASKPGSGLNNTMVDGIKVGNLFLTYDILVHSVETVPYLLHPFCGARLVFDREDTIKPLQEKIRSYFDDHPEIVEEWNGHYRQFREEKAQFGYEKTTIIDVWNELERRHSGGKTRRRFFNAFYFSNRLIFSVVKKLLSGFKA